MKRFSVKIKLIYDNNNNIDERKSGKIFHNIELSSGLNLLPVPVYCQSNHNSGIADQPEQLNTDLHQS